MADDKRDADTVKQMQPTQFPLPQRKVPTTMKDFRHEHEWVGQETGGKRCKTCGTVVA